MQRDPEIQALLDKQALRELALRYARAIDRRDRELLLSVYHEDAVDRHGTVFEGSPRQFADFQPQVMGQFAVTAHYMLNTDYRLAGDRAEGELYFIAFHRLQPPQCKEVVVGGRYLDRYERRGGVWKIAHRTLLWDFARDYVPSADEQKFLASLGELGGGAEDPSFRLLPLFAMGRSP